MQSIRRLQFWKLVLLLCFSRTILHTICLQNEIVWMRWKFRPALYRSFEAALSAFLYLQFTNFKQSVSLFFLFNFNFLDMKWNLICSTRFLMQVQFDFVYDREKGRSKTNKGGCNAYIWNSQPTLGNRLLLLHHCNYNVETLGGVRTKLPWVR